MAFVCVPFFSILICPLIRNYLFVLICSYGLIYLILTTIPAIFQDIYGEPIGIAGLHYLALGVGLTGASQINARLLDRIYKYYKEKNGGHGRPEFRLRKLTFTSFLLSPVNAIILIASMVPGTIFLPIGLLLNGWTAQNHVFWLVPDIVSTPSHHRRFFHCLLTFITGNRLHRRRDDPQLPVHPDVRHRRLHITCCIRFGSISLLYFYDELPVLMAILTVNSSSCGVFPSLPCRVWFSALRARDVQSLGVRKGRYYSCGVRYSRWVSCVSLHSSLLVFSSDSDSVHVDHGCFGTTANGSG